MCAEALERAVAFVSPGPVIQFPSQIADLLPQQTRRSIATARLEFNNGCRDFDHTRVEINRASRRQLKRFAGPRNHSTSHQTTRIAKHLFRTPSASINYQIEFRFQPNHSARRRCDLCALAKNTCAACCSMVLHLVNPRLTRFAAFAWS
jgi:hypothetical protein